MDLEDEMNTTGNDDGYVSNRAPIKLMQIFYQKCFFGGGGGGGGGLKK